MTIKSGFFDSLNGDRKYSAGDFGSIFEGVINDGVFSTVGDKFRVVATTTANTVQVSTGRAWLSGTWIVNDAPANVTLSAPDTSGYRIDTLVLESNKMENVRSGRLTWFSGAVHATNPTQPPISSTATVARVPIAHIRRRPNATTITTADITNVVGTAACPFVTGPLKTIDVDHLYTSWSSGFTDWMNLRKTEFTQWYGSLTNLLTSNAEAQIAAKITEQDQKISAVTSVNTTQSNSIDDLTTRVGRLDSSYGPVSLNYVAGIGSVGTNKIRVRGGAVYIQGTFRFDKPVTVGTTTSVQIASYPSALSDHLRQNGWSEGVGVGIMVCPGNNATMMLVSSDSGLYMGYRTANPGAGSWITMSATGMLPW